MTTIRVLSCTLLRHGMELKETVKIAHSKKDAIEESYPFNYHGFKKYLTSSPFHVKNVLCQKN